MKRFFQHISKHRHSDIDVVTVVVTVTLFDDALYFLAALSFISLTFFGIVIARASE